MASLGHVVGERVAAHRQRFLAELLGEVALRVEVDEQDALAEAGQVFEGEGVVAVAAVVGVRVVGFVEEGGEVLGDAYGHEGGGVFGEGLARPGGDGGLADAALLVADDDAPHDGGPPYGGGGVVVEPYLYGLGEALDEGDAPVLAVGSEAGPLGGGEEGGERFGAGGVDGGEVRAEAAPGRDAGLDGFLDVDSALCRADLQLLAKPQGELRDDLLPVASGVR